MTEKRAKDVIVYEPSAILPAGKKALTLWKPERALPIVGATATALWLGKRIAGALWRHRNLLKYADIPSTTISKREPITEIVSTDAHEAQGQVIYYYERRTIIVRRKAKD
jgi:hypothetical protein